VNSEVSTSLGLQKPSGPLEELTDSIKKDNEPVHEVSHLLIASKCLVKDNNHRLRTVISLRYVVCPQALYLSAITWRTGHVTYSTFQQTGKH